MFQAVRNWRRTQRKLLAYDRGVIAEGKRADLVLAHRVDGHQLVSRVCNEGKKVF